MPIPHIDENLLDQYALGTLSTESVAAVEEHLLLCSFCQSRLVEADELSLLFREAAILEDASANRPWLSAFTFRTGFWRGVAAATALLILLITGDYDHSSKVPTAILLLQSLRGPEDGAKMASARPCLLVLDVAFDAAVPGNRPDYDIEIVDAVGNKVLKKSAEVRDGRLAVLVEGLARGSY